LSSGQTKIDCLGQARRGVLNIKAGTQRNPVKQAIGDRWLNIKSGEFRPQCTVATYPTGVVVRLQAKWHAQTDSNGQISVLRTPENRLRQINVGQQMIDTTVAAVSTADRDFVERRVRQPVT